MLTQDQEREKVEEIYSKACRCILAINLLCMIIFLTHPQRINIVAGVPPLLSLSLTFFNIFFSCFSRLCLLSSSDLGSFSHYPQAFFACLGENVQQSFTRATSCLSFIELSFSLDKISLEGHQINWDSFFIFLHDSLSLLFLHFTVSAPAESISELKLFSLSTTTVDIWHCWRGFLWREEMNDITTS